MKSENIFTSLATYNCSQREKPRQWDWWHWSARAAAEAKGIWEAILRHVGHILPTHQSGKLNGMTCQWMTYSVNPYMVGLVEVLWTIQANPCTLCMILVKTITALSRIQGLPFHCIWLPSEDGANTLLKNKTPSPHFWERGYESIQLWSSHQGCGQVHLLEDLREENQCVKLHLAWFKLLWLVLRL